MQTIPCEILDVFSLTIEELFEAAKKNTLAHYGIELFSGRELGMLLLAGLDFFSWHPAPFEDVKMDREGFYIVTNRIRLNGSALILIPEVLEALGQKAGCDYYVLPSSINEFQIDRDVGLSSPDFLKSLIYSSNRNPNMIRPDTVLTDTLYRYSRETKTLSIV